MRSLALAVSIAALTLAGCGSPCEDLADRICNCESPGTVQGFDVTGITTAQDTCKSSVKNQIGSATQRPGPADQEFCQSKLATCPDPANGAPTCQLLLTQAGKEACGLAYPAQ